MTPRIVLIVEVVVADGHVHGELLVYVGGGHELYQAVWFVLEGVQAVKFHEAQLDEIVPVAQVCLME